MLKITSKSKNEILAWILKANVLLALWFTETGAVTQCVNNEARKSKYSRTSIRRPPIKQPTFIWKSAAKILEKVVSYTL